MRADITPGAAILDYELPDHAGRRRRLSEIQAEDPMVTRPSPRVLPGQGSGTARRPRREIKPAVGYGQMVTITTTDPQEALSYPDGGWAEWPFPADPGRIVQRDLDIAEYTGPGHNQIVPHRSCASPARSCTRSTTRTGSSGATRSRSYAAICARWSEAPLGLGAVKPRGQVGVGAPPRSIVLPTRAWLAQGRLGLCRADDLRRGRQRDLGADAGSLAGWAVDDERSLEGRHSVP
jgi:hypothetical protein